MASDCPPGQPVVTGNNVQLSASCSSREQIENLFKVLSAGGKVIQPLHDAFWGARFGLLMDRYGFYWMLSFEKK